jgi:hypothetical protein
LQKIFKSLRRNDLRVRAAATKIDHFQTASLVALMDRRRFLIDSAKRVCLVLASAPVDELLRGVVGARESSDELRWFLNFSASPDSKAQVKQMMSVAMRLPPGVKLGMIRLGTRIDADDREEYVVAMFEAIFVRPTPPNLAQALAALDFISFREFPLDHAQRIVERLRVDAAAENEP